MASAPSSPPSSTSPNASGSPSKVVRTRDGRGQSKKPEGQMTITAVNDDGVPLSPEKAAARFRTLYGILGREQVPITTLSWDTLTKDQRAELWTTISKSFTIPEAHKARVQRHALLSMGKAWRTFKSTLVTKYVNTGRTPFTAYKHISRDIWDAFVQMKTTAEFREQSAAHKALQKLNTHPHRLGTAGYAGKTAQWAAEDENATRPFAEITDERARPWLRARASITSSGEISFPNPADQEVAKRVHVLTSACSEGSFQPDREKDILSTALGNKEHPGRTRGKGVNVTWMRGFADDYYTYRSRKRTRDEHDNQLEMRLTARFEGQNARFEGHIARLEDRINQLLNQSQGAPVILEGSPTQHRSSVASTQYSEHDDVQLPIDAIKEATHCTLQVRMVGMSVEAGRGVAYPCQEGTVQHGAQVAQGYARVHVDMVHDNLRAVPLEIHPNEEIRTLGDALYTFILWPKKDIALDPAVPPQLSIQKASPTGPSMTPPQPSRDDHASPTGPSMTPPQPSLQKPASSVPESSHRKTRSSQVVQDKSKSVPESSHRKTHSGQVVQYKSKSKNIKAPPPSKPMTYSFGRPLLTNTELAYAGISCQGLHGWYMQKTKEKGCNDGITVIFTEEHFFHEPAPFIVSFDDLFDLFNLKPLDASLLRCWTLYMMKIARQLKEPVGFLDPHVVSEQTILADASYVEKYITTGLLAQNGMDYIMVPYNQKAHWILIVIIPKRNQVLYLDSLLNKGHDFTLVQALLERSFISYVADGGLYKGSNATLQHRPRFPCRQQKAEECAFYVCHHMQQIMGAKLKDPESLNIDLDPLVTREIWEVRGRLCDFIKTQIINADGEFHYSVNTAERPSNN